MHSSQPGALSSECEDLGDRAEEFFRYFHGHRLNAMNTRYILPADDDELKRSEYNHRLMQFVFEGKNYVGPVKDVLTSGSPHKRRILDLGTGSGLWAVEMADEFPDAEVIGVDLAPIQPLDVPPNCEFELCDLDIPNLPYPSNHFDLIHARSIHTGISNYPRFLLEITRMLRPGGIVLLIELDTQPVADGKRAPEGYTPGALPPGGMAFASGALGWFAAWDAYRSALVKQGIDLTVPRRLGQLIWGTRAYDMSQTFAQEAEIPIGFHPKDPTLLTIGQLAWMGYDLLLHSIRPYLHVLGLDEWQVESLIEEGQSDLYYPVVHLSTRLHVVRGIKK